MNSRLPARLDRAALDRILHRAAELQTGARDVGDGLTEEEVVALGAEVGLSESYLKHALLEERTRHDVPAPTGTLDRWVGVADLAAERVVQGEEAAIRAKLSRWLESNEHLVVQREVAGRATYEPMNSFVGAMRRVGAMFDGRKGRSYLDKVELLTAVITPLEPGYHHVRLAAGLRGTRRGYVAGSVTLVGTGVMLGGLMTALGAPLLLGLVPLLPLTGGAWITATQYRKLADRTQLGLERALDELEHRPLLMSAAGDTAPHPIAKGVGRLVRDISREVRRAIDE